MSAKQKHSELAISMFNEVSGKKSPQKAFYKFLVFL